MGNAGKSIARIGLATATGGLSEIAKAKTDSDKLKKEASANAKAINAANLATNAKADELAAEKNKVALLEGYKDPYARNLLTDEDELQKKKPTILGS